MCSIGSTCTGYGVRRLNVGEDRGNSQYVRVNETDYRGLSDNSVDYARVYGFIWIWLMSLAQGCFSGVSQLQWSEQSAERGYPDTYGVL
jgi:hypothetical protein